MPRIAKVAISTVSFGFGAALCVALRGTPPEIALLASINFAVGAGVYALFWEGR